jgi:phage gp36-like protein
MGTYATADEIRRRYPRLFEKLNIDAGEVEAAIDDVENQIDGIVGSKYAVPFAAGAVPPLIRLIAKDLASYRTLRQRIINEQPTQSDWVETLKEDANKYLDQITEGKLQLVLAGGATVDPRADSSTTPWSSTAGYVPTFGVIPMTRQEIDPDRLEDEDNERAT